jgi:hypothetical protein
MSKITRETAYATSLAGGLLLIHHDKLWDNGLTMGGDLIAQLTAAPWLADQIQQAADEWSAPDVDRDIPPDHFRIYPRGGEHGEDIDVNLINLRDPAAQRGKTYALSVISPTAAHKVAADLRALAPQ